MSKVRIYIAGHNGMVGSALVRKLKKNKNVIVITRKKNELDLINQNQVQNFFKDEKIDQVYLAAAKVGGIYANSKYPADFIYQNIMIQTNVIHFAFLSGIKKLLFLGSSCIYPKQSKQPMKENELLNGKLEPTNEPYAIAKITGIKMCESYNRQYYKSHNLDYRSIMPTNLYGPGDNFDSLTGHVIPSLIYRFHEGKIKNKSKVNIWGKGIAKREFLFVDDMADASIHLMNLSRKKYKNLIKPMCSHINVGSGIEVTIRELAKLVKEVVGYKGKIVFDKTKPDGNLRKFLNSNKIKSLGWKPKYSLYKGLKDTYKYFLRYQ